MKASEFMVGDWVDIPEFEGLYQVSSNGEIKSLEKIITSYGGKRSYIQKEHIVKQYKDTSGYNIVRLSKQGEMYTRKVHRLVAICFIPNPYKYTEINHKDENKTNNNFSNLEWCTKAYNNSYGTRTERTSRKVISIDIDGKETVYKSVREASRITKTATCNIRNCANNKVLTDSKGNNYNCITAGGYKWKWYD